MPIAPVTIIARYQAPAARASCLVGMAMVSVDKGLPLRRVDDGRSQRWGGGRLESALAWHRGFDGVFLVGRGGRGLVGAGGVVEEVARLAVERDAELAEGLEADALHLAGAEEREVRLGDSDLGREVFCALLAAREHDVERDDDGHRIDSDDR